MHTCTHAHIITFASRQPAALFPKKWRKKSREMQSCFRKLFVLIWDNDVFCSFLFLANGKAVAMRLIEIIANDRLGRKGEIKHI